MVRFSGALRDYSNKTTDAVLPWEKHPTALIECLRVQHNPSGAIA